MVVDASVGYAPPSKYQLSIAEQCYRYVIIRYDSTIAYKDLMLQRSTGVS